MKEAAIEEDLFKDEPLDTNTFFNDDFGGFNDFGGGFGNDPLHKHSDLLKELTNFSPLIQARVRNWLGLEWDDKIQNYVKKEHAIMNERCARWCIGFLQNYQAKTNIITNINEREFKNLQLDIIKICWLVFPTRDDFGIETSADWYRLCTELEHAAFLVLAGAGDGKYTKFLGESVTRSEHVNINPQGMQSRPQMTGNPGIFNTIKNKLLGRN